MRASGGRVDAEDERGAHQVGARHRYDKNKNSFLARHNTILHYAIGSPPPAVLIQSRRRFIEK